MFSVSYPLSEYSLHYFVFIWSIALILILFDVLVRAPGEGGGDLMGFTGNMVR